MGNEQSGKTIALPFYKGGTGKTTLITNVSALCAQNGFNVGLMAFDYMRLAWRLISERNRVRF